MAEITRTFTKGRMNKDIDKRILVDGEYTDALNITVGASEEQKVGSIQNDLGNEKLSDLATVSGQLVVNAKTIATISVPSLNLVYWFVSSDKFDGIYELDRSDNTVTRVLQSNKSNPSDISKLEFNQGDLITGINYISGLILWTDLRNGPRKINVSRCKSYAIDDPMIVKDLYLIVRPPLFSPSLRLTNDESQSNNMSDKFLYFSYRFKYSDNEYSSLSPFSSVAFYPKEYTYDPQKGYTEAMTNKYNKVDITVQTGNELVTDIQIIMYDTSSKNTFIVETLNKELLQIADNSSYVFEDFSNNKVYTSLPSTQITRLFDNVPLGAKAQTIIGNRLVFGNIIQFRNITNSNGQPIKIDFNVSFASDLAFPTKTNPSPTFKSNRDYELALVYLDEYGRMTTGLTSNTNTVFIPHEKAFGSNSLLVNIKSPAPSWATHWRMYIKQSKEEYYTLYPILFYKEGPFRYFLITQTDKDKIREGDYIVFKSTSEGLSYSGKEYKVLEVAQKGADFLGGNTTTELAGLYFKIKVDNNSELSPNSLFQYSSSGTGCNTTRSTTFNQGEVTFPPITGSFQYVENAIFYGTGNESSLTSINNSAWGISDVRFTVEIDSPTTFRYSKNLDGAGPYIQENVPITPGIQQSLFYSSFYLGLSIHSAKIVFNTNVGLVIGDKWKVSVRGQISSTFNPQKYNYFGGVLMNLMQQQYSDVQQHTGGFAIIPGENWSPNSSVEIDRPILPGAVITLGLIEDRYNPGGTTGAIQFPPSDSYYENIEEWFVESGAYQLYHQYNDQGQDVGASKITFRRGGIFTYGPGTNGGDDSNTVFAGNSITPWTLNLPVRMFIEGYGTYDGDPDNQNHVTAVFKIQQQESQNIIETVPLINDTDIYHELIRTKRVGENGEHIVNWHYDDFIFHSSSDSSNAYTGLTQFTNYEPHYFNIGDEINVVTSVPWINGQRTIIAIPNAYTIVINVPFLASGPVTPGYIEANDYDLDQSLTSPQGAKILINNDPNNYNDAFNAWSFGNGIESNRIKDDFNAVTLKYSQRATSNIEDYKQEHNENELVYSGVYQLTTQTNKLNEFNLSTANFKYADKLFGSIQKLYARNSDLLMMQEHKVCSVLYGKNLLSDSVGGGNIVSIPEVLGEIIPLPYENGVSKNPESFAIYGEDIFITDSYRGNVLQINGSSMIEVSGYGMKNYFKDMFLDGLNTRKIGVFDPWTRNYVIGSNNINTFECYLRVSRSVVDAPVGPIGNARLFEIESNSNWSIELIDTGDGTFWLDPYPVSGNDNGKIKGSLAENDTFAVRSLIIRITYCGGLTVDVVINQQPKRIEGTGGVYFINKKEDESKIKIQLYGVE